MHYEKNCNISTNVCSEVESCLNVERCLFDRAGRERLAGTLLQSLLDVHCKLLVT